MAVAIVALASTLAGCISSGPTERNAEETLERMQFIVDDAREYGVSEAQLTVLEDAVQAKALLYEDLSQLLLDFQECVEDVGGEVRLLGAQQEPASLPAPGYAVIVPTGPGEEAILRSADQCGRFTFAYAESMYNAQPAALETYDAHFESNRSAYLTCLEEHGREIAQDATVDELVVALSQDFRDPNRSSPACFEGSTLSSRRR